MLAYDDAGLRRAAAGTPAQVLLRPDRAQPELLVDAARTEAARLDLLVGMTALSGFAEIARGADRVLRRDLGYQAEMSTWTHADAAPDGVAVPAGAPVSEPQDLLPQRAFSDRRPGHPARRRAVEDVLAE